MTRQPVSTIRNLGPKSDESFARAGIDSAETLRNLGAEEAYRRLLRAGTRPHFIGFYALVMGLQGRPWNDAQGEEKADLRKRFDAIVAQEKGRPDIEAALDMIGVGRRR
ncbi:MAG: TfoX/Sxy family protein [Pseudomonadota bacterium]